MFCQKIPGATGELILENNKQFCHQRGCTSDRNSLASYCLEQQARAKIMDHRLFYNGPNGQTFNPAMPDFVRQGRMPASNFSFNAVDIESSLFIIGSCNLVEPKPEVVPRFKDNLQEIKFFERPEMVNQEPFVPVLDQRPWPICQNYS